jgi:hypothetical protein
VRENNEGGERGGTYKPSERAHLALVCLERGIAIVRALRVLLEPVGRTNEELHQRTGPSSAIILATTEATPGTFFGAVVLAVCLPSWSVR